MSHLQRSHAVVSLCTACATAACLSLVGCGGGDASPGVGDDVDSGTGGGGTGAGGGNASGGMSSTGGAGGTDAAGGTGSGASPSEGGTGGTPSSLPPNAIAGAPFGTCALDELGAIHCWGLSRISPAGWIIPSGDFVQIRGSRDLFCAIRADRTVACFFEPVGTPGALDYAPTGSVREIAMSRGAICGIDESGGAFCNWDSPVYELTLPPGETFDHISVGSRFACGIRSTDATLTCFGLGGLPGDCTPAPVAGQLDAPAGQYVAIESSSSSSCAIREDGTLACWGAGSAGADPNALHCTTRFNFGQSVPPPGTFRSVSVGESNACGIRSDGTLACWGAGTTTLDCSPDTDEFECGQSVPPAGIFEQVAVSRRHACAMRADRTVACWGWDGDGDGRTTPPAPFQ